VCATCAGTRKLKCSVRPASASSRLSRVCLRPALPPGAGRPPRFGEDIQPCRKALAKTPLARLASAPGPSQAERVRRHSSQAFLTRFGRKQKTRRSPSTARRIPERRALIPNDRLTCDRADHISERGSTPKFDAPKQRLHRRRNPQSGASGRDERAKESSAIKAIVFGEISGGRWVSSGSRSDFPTHSMCWRP
jgi:hypothetical protein